MFWFKHRRSVSFVGGVLGALIISLSLFLVPQSHTQAQSSLDSFQKDVDFMRSNAEATLLFNPFGTNPDSRFKKHYLSEDQIAYLCRNAPCERMGINTASPFTSLRKDRPYSRADRLGMDYMLEIISTSNVSAAANRIYEERNNFKIIVRFGVGGGGLGVTSDPQSMVNLLKNLDAAVNSDPSKEKVEFYAIAGPNEPDLETWWQVPGAACGEFPANGNEGDKQSWYDCVAPQLADYSNAVCNAQAQGDIPNNVKLLTPAFNLTSASFGPLYDAWLAAGANLSCFEGAAGNIYPNGGSVQQIWETQYIDRINLPIFITETGPWTSLPTDDASSNSWYNSMAGAEITGAIYVNPILGVFPPASRDVGEIRDSLVNQGYQAYCATPTYIIEPKVTGAIDTFIKNIKQGHYTGTTLDVGSTQIIDYTEAQAPIFRDTDRKRQLKSDLEEYFGYKQVEETENYGQTEVQSAAISSLLSDVQKCVQTADNLEIQEIMCNKLVLSDQCALYASQIPGTNYTVERLLGEYKAYAGIGSDKLEICKEIVVGEGGEELRAGMVNATSYFERASRIAFLVLAVVQKPVEKDMLFNFFSGDSAEPRHEVLIVAFRVPDIGTNKGSTWETESVTNAAGEELYTQVKRDNNGRKVEKVESGHTFWNDPMTLIRNVLVPRKTAERLDIEGTEYREELRAAGAAATMQGPQSLIYCLEGQAPDGTGSETCNNEVGKAVVDIVNATWTYDKERVTCDNLTIDEVEEVGETTKLGYPGATTYFWPDFGEYILQNITSVDRGEQDFNSELQITEKTWEPKDCVPLGQGEGAEGDCTTLNYYLVYPMGYDLETLEYVMARTFLTASQFEQYTDNPDIKERFNIFGDEVELDSDTEEYRFTDKTNCKYNRFGQEECPEEEFEATIVSNQGSALFFGGRLGFWVREVQKIFNRANSLSYAYLTKCRSTEEFLLDQCGGAPGSTTYDASNYCSNELAGKIVRDVDNQVLSRFKFYSSDGLKIDDSENIFFPAENELGCSLNMSARAVDGLTLILSGGQDILPNNPGNVLGCVGTVSVASRVRIYRLPPETSPPPLSADDPRWENAEYMQTSGGSASQIEYDLTLSPAYYLVKINVKGNSICLSNFTRIMDNRDPASPYKQIGTEGYVIDFTDDAICKDGACMDASLQYAMEGGGPVYKEDEDGNRVIDYTVHYAEDFVEDILGCQISFSYDILQWNNTCGGGRKHGCADPEGTLGGNCGYWDSFIDSINSGSVEDLWKKGYEAYKSVFGRKLKKTGSNFNCTAARSGLADPIFSNTISVHNCSTYAGSLDSLRLFGEVVGFQIEWWDGNDLFIQMPLPPENLWKQIVAAEEKYGCDKWLMLGLASSEGPLGTYLNDNQPNYADAQGFFSLTGTMWDRWKTPDDASAEQCLQKQPAAFNPADFNSYSDVHDIGAQVDQACRIALYSGIQKYPEDKVAFRKAFYAYSTPDENSLDYGWSTQQTAQSEYVWTFWKKARESAQDPVKAQPANWPPPLCDGSTNASTPKDGDIDAWKAFVNYDQPTQLPSSGITTYYAGNVMNNELNNQIYANDHIAEGLIKNCELTNPDSGSTLDRWSQAQQQAANNGDLQVVGCASMYRLGDVPFAQTGNKNDVRTVWVSVDSGPLAGTAIGPLAVIGVAAQNHLQLLYERHGGNWLIDLDYSTFRMLYDTGAWSAPQNITVCDTKEQCEQ